MAHLIQRNGPHNFYCLFSSLLRCRSVKCIFRGGNTKCVSFLCCQHLTSFSSTKKNMRRKRSRDTLWRSIKLAPIQFCAHSEFATQHSTNFFAFLLHQDKTFHVTTLTMPRSFSRLIEFRCMQIVCVQWFGEIGIFISHRKEFDCIQFGVCICVRVTHNAKLFIISNFPSTDA